MGLELWLHTHTGNKGSAPPQILSPHSAAKAIRNKYNENYAPIHSILTAAESVATVFCLSQG